MFAVTAAQQNNMFWQFNRQGNFAREQEHMIPSARENGM
jgi:hypothetical protein